MKQDARGNKNRPEDGVTHGMNQACGPGAYFQITGAEGNVSRDIDRQENGGCSDPKPEVEKAELRHLELPVESGTVWWDVRLRHGIEYARSAAILQAAREAFG